MTVKYRDEWPRLLSKVVKARNCIEALNVLYKELKKEERRTQRRTKQLLGKKKRRKRVSRKAIVKLLISSAQGMKLSNKYPITKKNLEAFKQLGQVVAKYTK